MEKHILLVIDGKMNFLYDVCSSLDSIKNFQSPKYISQRYTFCTKERKGQNFDPLV